MNMPVCVVSYGRPHYLEACLESLRASEYWGHEAKILIFDDCSPRPTKDLILKELGREWEVPIEARFRPYNLGWKANFIRSIRQAFEWVPEAEAVAVVESDVVVAPKWYRVAAESLWVLGEEKLGFLSLCDGANGAGPCDRQGVGFGLMNRKQHGYKSLRGQCYVVTRALFEELGISEINNHDSGFRDGAVELGYAVYATNPSYAQHIGVIPVVEEMLEKGKGKKRKIRNHTKTYHGGWPEGVMFPEELEEFRELLFPLAPRNTEDDDGNS